MNRIASTMRHLWIRMYAFGIITNAAVFRASSEYDMKNDPEDHTRTEDDSSRDFIYHACG